MPDRPLTTKQKKYVEGKLRGQTGVQAVIEAGYKGSNGVLRSIASQNLTKLNIKAELDKRRAEIEVRTDITVLYIQQELEDAKTKAATKRDFSTVARCIELQGRTIGAFIDKQVNLNADVGRRPPDVEAARQLCDQRYESISVDNKDT